MSSGNKLLNSHAIEWPTNKMRLILGMIHDLKMGDSQAIFVGLHFHPCDLTRGGGMVSVQGPAAEGRALPERSMAGEQ